MNLLAVDTETELIPDRTQVLSRSGRRIWTGPYQTPRVVLVSLCRDGETATLTNPSYGRVCIAKHLHAGGHIVGHNINFDIDVLSQDATPDVAGRIPFENAINTAINEGRVHDTMHLDVLVGLAWGKFDLPYHDEEKGTWQQRVLKTRTLEALAARYADMELNKDPAIRLGYGQFLGQPIEDLPPRFRKYAMEDAIATYRVYMALRQKMVDLELKGDLSEQLQVQASIVMREMDKRGIGVDREQAKRVAVEFEKDLEPLEEKLVECGFGGWTKDGKICHKAETLGQDTAYDWRRTKTRPMTGAAWARLSMSSVSRCFKNTHVTNGHQQLGSSQPRPSAPTSRTISRTSPAPQPAWSPLTMTGSHNTPPRTMLPSKPTSTARS
jgi:DNA polymerase III epsilon subunit-like protein